MVAFFALNKALKRTCWWRNIFVFTKQFSNDPTFSESFSVVNVGSNPARFAFFYDNVLGENWSTGVQGLDFDLDILRKYSWQLKPGAYVLLPIVPFSSVSGYLTRYSKSYSAKYASVLGIRQGKSFTKLREGIKYLRFPLMYNWRAITYLIRDANPDNRLNQIEQQLQLYEMENNAEWWMSMWKKEFSICDWESMLPDHLKEGRVKSILMMSELIEYIQENGFKPVIVSPPMSNSLCSMFTPLIKDTYIYSFVKSIQNKYNVLYLDYLDDKDLQDPQLYFNALFMNLRGRKLFTRRVLTDLNIITT